MTVQPTAPASSQALATEVGGKDGRASARTMARLLQHLLARHPDASRRGFVLDGWPRMLAQARAAFSPQAAAGAGAGPSAQQQPPAGQPQPRASTDASAGAKVRWLHAAQG